MRKRIISILILVLVILLGNTSFAVNTNYNSLDYEIDELNKQIDAIKKNYNGNTYSGSYSSKYNSTNSTYNNSVNNSYSNTYNSTNDGYTANSYNQNTGDYQLIIEDDG